MLKLCPLFLEGPNLYVQIIILPNNVHRDCITNLKPGLDAYWEIYTKTTWTMYCSFSYHVKTLSLGQGPQAWGWDISQSETGTGTHLLGTRHSLWTRLPVYLRHYAQNLLFLNNAQCFLVPIFSQHNPLNPPRSTYLTRIYIRDVTYYIFNSGEVPASLLKLSNSLVHIESLTYIELCLYPWLPDSPGNFLRCRRHQYNPSERLLYGRAWIIYSTILSVGRVSKSFDRDGAVRIFVRMSPAM